MKLIPTITAILSGTLLLAQSNQFQITVTRDESIQTAFVLNSMNVVFSTSGSHFTDALDQAGSVNDPSFMYPYTIDSALVDIVTTDSRPSLRKQITVPFGVWTAVDGEMHVQGTWSNPMINPLYEVILTDNQTGFTYDLYNEVVLSVITETAFNNRFTITFKPKARFLAFDESCYGQADGSIYAESPQANWSMKMFVNNMYQSTINVTGTDTLLTGMAAANYEFIYILDAVNIDTVQATVAGPVQVLSSSVPTNANPLTNEAVTFSNSSSGAIEYVWNFGDSTTSTDFSPIHTYTSPGTYTVTLTAYNAAGCEHSSTYTITVTNGLVAGPQLQDRNNTQSQNTARAAGLNVQSHEGQAQISSVNEITISQLSVFSLSGQMIYTGTGNQNTFNYTAPGIYIAHITYANGTMSAEHLMLK